MGTHGTGGSRGSASGGGIVIGMLASAPFAVTLFAVAMMFGGDLGERRELERDLHDQTSVPNAPEPAKAKPSRQREEVTYEPWELVST